MLFYLFYLVHDFLRWVCFIVHRNGAHRNYRHQLRQQLQGPAWGLALDRQHHDPLQMRNYVSFFVLNAFLQVVDHGEFGGFELLEEEESGDQTVFVHMQGGLLVRVQKSSVDEVEEN